MDSSQNISTNNSCVVGIGDENHCLLTLVGWIQAGAEFWEPRRIRRQVVNRVRVESSSPVRIDVVLLGDKWRQVPKRRWKIASSKRSRPISLFQSGFQALIQPPPSSLLFLLLTPTNFMPRVIVELDKLDIPEAGLGFQILGPARSGWRKTVQNRSQPSLIIIVIVLVEVIIIVHWNDLSQMPQLRPQTT